MLLDHVVFSPACYDGGKLSFVKDSGQVEHKAHDKHVVNKGKTRDDRPSDHKPLSARFALMLWGQRPDRMSDRPQRRQETLLRAKDPAG